ncbi:hypothetical protein MCEMRE226_00051 [Candidatus Nanopelagicaceae bacterium]
MSTKTTFKRVALVAVAALGLGVLSVAPSTATVSALSVTITNGTSTQNQSDSLTAAVVAVSALLDHANDTVTVSVVAKGDRPTTTGSYVNPTVRFGWLETTTSATSGVSADLVSTEAGLKAFGGWNHVDSMTKTTYSLYNTGATTTGYAGAKFWLQLDSVTAVQPGTYAYTIIVKSYNHAGSQTITTETRDINITVATPAADSKVANSGTSTAVLQRGSSFTSASSQDSVVAVVATASSTDNAVIGVNLRNASNGLAANESITATITGPGVIGAAGGTYGKSVVIAHTAGANFVVGIRADGNAGTATINLSTPSVTFSPKTVTFYAKSPKTITAAVYNPVLNVGANSTAIAATAVDAGGINWAGQLYVKAVAAADALVGGSATDPVACSYSAADLTHFCPVTTLTPGTAKFVVVDESNDTDAVYTAADSAATSNEVTVTVSSGVATTVKLAFDKATYAPFEKATITVTPLDAAGKTLGTKTITNLFATGGITSNVAFGSSSDTLTAVTLTTAAANGTSTTAGAYTYTVYMPAQGDVTISATGGTGLAAAGQVKVTAAASIVNSSVDAATDAANEATDAANAATDAALAAADAADAATAAAQDASDAVAALSASVSKLISSLRAQITSLTNLVIKIQKKVRA